MHDLVEEVVLQPFPYLVSKSSHDYDMTMIIADDYTQAENPTPNTEYAIVLSRAMERLNIDDYNVMA